MAAFHAAPWPERAELVESFEDDRLRELGRRIVFYECPEALRPERRQMLEVWLQNRRHGREGVEAGRTIADAIEELDGPQTEELSAIRRWLVGMAAN